MIDYRTASFRDLRNHFLKNTSFYGFGFILVRAGNLIFLPLYWMALEPADFGIIAISQVILAVLTPILTLSCSDSVERLYHEWIEAERPVYLGALWIFSSLFGLVLCLLLDFFGSRIFSVLIESVPFDPYLRIALWTAFATSLTNIPLSLMKIREQIGRYTFVTTFSFLLQAGLILSFLFVFKLGVLGYLLASLLSVSLMCIYLIWFMRKEVSARFTWHHLRQPLAYSVPYIPNTVFEGIGVSLDRYFLDKYASLAVIGLYGLGYQIGSSLSIFNRVVKSSWLPFLFRVVNDREDAPHVLARFTSYHVAALIMPALAIAIFSEDLIRLINNPRYFDVAIFVPYFVLTYFIISLAVSLGRGMDLSKRTWPSVFVPLVGIAVNVIALSYLVPLYGVWGAIAATLIAATFKVSVQIFLAHWFYPRPTPYKLIFMIFGIGLLTSFAGINLKVENLALSIFVKALLLAFSFALILTVVFGRKKAQGVVFGLFRRPTS